MNCATHPKVQTELRCGHCGKAICPRCMVITPGGQRCITCARLRRPPMYEVSLLMNVRAALAAAGVGVAAGVAWGFMPRALGFFVFLLAAGLGYVMSEAVSWATNRKRGYGLQLIAGFGILFAYFARNLLFSGTLIVPGDIFGYIAVAIAIFVAAGALR